MTPYYYKIDARANVVLVWNCCLATTAAAADDDDDDYDFILL